MRYNFIRSDNRKDEMVLTYWLLLQCDKFQKLIAAVHQKKESFIWILKVRLMQQKGDARK